MNLEYFWEVAIVNGVIKTDKDGEKSTMDVIRIMAGSHGIVYEADYHSYDSEKYPVLQEICNAHNKTMILAEKEHRCSGLEGLVGLLKDAEVDVEVSDD